MQKQRWIDASLRASSVHSEERCLRPDADVGSDLRGNVSEPSVAKTQQLFLSWNWTDDKNWNTVRRMNLLICVHGCRILSIRMCRFFFDCSSKRFCTFVLVYISFLNPFLLPFVGVCDVIGGCDLFLSLLALPEPGPHLQHPGPSSAHGGDAGRRLRRRRHGGDFWTGGGGDGSYR